MLAFTRTDLERLFPSTTWQRAESLRDQSAVVEINVERDGQSITGRVRGERRTPFLTRVNIVNGRGGRVRLSSTCTCVVYSECEHAAATLLAALDETAAPDADEVNVAIDPELEGWIAAINGAHRALHQRSCRRWRRLRALPARADAALWRDSPRSSRSR